MRVLLLNGPSLNMLGTREPAIYGLDTLDEIIEQVLGLAKDLGVEIEALQSNHEGDLINFIQRRQSAADAMIINPGAFGNYSYALRDAISGSNLPTVEVHIANVHAREAYRETLVLSRVCRGVITGLGWRGYLYALESLVHLGKEGK